MRMNQAGQSWVPVAEPAANQSVRSRHEPIRRQCHYKNTRRANNTADNDHTIRGYALSHSADDRSEHNNNKGVDSDQFANRGVQSHLALPKFWEDVIRQQENDFKKSDEEEEHEQAIKCRLPEQTAKEIDRLLRARAHGRHNCRMRFTLPLFTFPQEINRGKKQDLERQTYRKELFVYRRLKPGDIHVQVERSNKIENVTGDPIADVHERVDDRECDRTLRGRGINSRRGQENR